MKKSEFLRMNKINVPMLQYPKNRIKINIFKNIPCLFIFILVAHMATSQVGFQWAKAFGGSTYDYGNSIDVDNFGNVYTTGMFSGTVDFDPGVGIYNLNGNYDVFISKLDASGNFIWAKTMGNFASEQGMSITIDNSGNIYTTGAFSSTTDFDPGLGIFNLTPSGSADIFISKLDAAGNFLWAKRIGASEEDYGVSIKTDASGNVYTTGIFNGWVDFDPSTGLTQLNSVGMGDIFIVKLDANGNFVWARGFGGPWNDQISEISLDLLGNVYTTGAFFQTADFNPGLGVNNLISGADGDAFISKLDASGNFVWAKQIGSAGQENGTSIRIDATNNIYTLGYFTTTVDFDLGAGNFPLTSNGSTDIFLLKLNAAGNFVSAKSFGGLVDDYGSSIDLDASNDVYISGRFSAMVDFNPNAGTYNLNSPTGSNVFISKIDSFGNFIWAKSFGGNIDDISESIAIHSSGTIHTIGQFNGTGDFDPNAGVLNLTSNGNSDVFIHKMSPCVPLIGVDTQTSCGSYTWIDGNIYSTSNSTATYVLTNAAGCDSIVTLNLTINNSNAGSESITACDAYTWSANGTNYTSGGTYTAVLTNMNGCDSTATLNLTINNSNAGSESITACDSYTWTANGTNYISSGTYTAVLTNMNGCDSTATLNLTINNSNAGSESITACDAYTWSANGTNYTSGGTYTAVLTNMNGCDSTATLNLTINNSNAGSESITACDSYTWTANGTNYTSGGTYTAVLTNMNGCDSTATLNLTINNSNAGTETITACDSYTWTANGTNYTSSGTYTAVLTNMNGCDSIATLNLTINNSNAGSETITACNSYTWSANGTNYISSGTYTAVLTNMNGCDSTATLNLTINNSNAGSETVTACDSYTWSANGTNYISSGTYTAVLTNMNGCDSIATLNLTINSVDITLTIISDVSLQANTSTAQYQWVDCDDSFNPIMNETNQLFVASINGNYAVEISENGCVDTSDCYVIDNVGNKEMTTSRVSVYPNPTVDFVTIELGSSSFQTIEVLDTWGRIVNTLSIGSSEVIVDLQKMQRGIYYLKIISENATQIEKVVKE